MAVMNSPVKTAVAITFMALVLASGLRGVVITPLSLTGAWREEIDCWEPDLNTLLLKATMSDGDMDANIATRKEEGGMLLTSK